MDDLQAQPFVVADRCSESGRLICKDSCYALRTGEGIDIWLEMDRIPLHLVEQTVKIEGQRYGRQLIQVEMIAPC
jgi:glutamate formiminotransferase